jgi:hypothetical protein
MRRTPVVLSVLGAAMFAADLHAQDASAAPSYGDVRVVEGFVPDPIAKALTAGGSIEVDVTGCSYGFVAAAPDIDLYYDTSGGTALYIYVQSDDDTTLLVNLPDGSWVCDDDGFEGRSPLVVIPEAAPGLYDVWVGTYGDEMVAAALLISERDPGVKPKE